MSAIAGFRDIHAELADLNKEAAELAAKIHENFEELVYPGKDCGVIVDYNGTWAGATLVARHAEHNHPSRGEGVRSRQSRVRLRLAAERERA